MHRHCYPTLLLLLIQTWLFAQEPCGTDLLHQQALNNPAYAAKHAVFEQKILQKAKSDAPDAAQMVVTLPIVVHVIHDGGNENITNAQILLGIQQLNEAFANTGYYDQGTGTDVMIQFCMAQRTPNNQPTNGINRVQDPLTELEMETQDDQMKALSYWDATQYVNIWLVRSICSASIGCGVAGYANFPSSHGSPSDGIVMEAGWMGSTPANTGVLMHEMGHYLGLYHTFQGGCTNNDCLVDGDRVCDTPPDQSTLWTPCSATPNTCNTDAQSGFATDQNDMISNFMDYADFNCFHDFTPGQSVRMNAAVQTARKSLLSSPGCLSPCPNPVTAMFSTTQTQVNQGGSLTFTNTSTNGIAYQWLINGVPFSTATHFSYTFNAEGFYTIALLATGAQPDLCFPDSFGVTVEVRCPVVADFSPSAFQVQPGQTVVFSNNSLNANQFEWFIEGISQGPALSSYTFTQPGAYAVRLVAGNGLCENTRVHYLSVIDSCNVQTFQITYGNDQENIAVRSVYLTDGTLLIAGTTRNANNTTDVVLMKLTVGGAPVWTKIFGQPSSNETVGFLRALPGGAFAATLTTSFYSGNSDPMMVLFNPDGTTQWQRYLNTSSDDNFQNLNMTPDGGFIVCGAIRPNPWWDAYALKISADGTQEWAKQYQGGNTDFFTEIKPLPTGGYIATGFTLSYGQNTATIHDGMMAKLDDQGNVLWTKAYGQTGNEGFGRVFLTADGGFLNIGGSGSFNGNNNDTYFDDVWAVKTDGDGNLQWAKAYRTNLNIDCTARGSVEGNDGGYVLSGNDFGNLGVFETFFFKISDLGDVEWSRVYGGSGTERVVDVAATPTGYLLPGATNSIGAGNFDFYIVKTDNAGYAGDCFEVPHTVTEQNILPLVEDGTLQVLQPPSLLVGNIPVNDIPTPFDLNGFCTYNCYSEICNNGVDDDGDGLFDCLDPDCDCSTCEPGNANIWYFGNKSGLDFSQNPPAVLTDGQSVSFEASAVASDPFGNLLFYTNGATIYNRNHMVMPNGGGLNGQSSTSQCIIVPHPGNPALYFVFTSASYDTPPTTGTHYSVVDMSLYGGLGDVAPGQKNITLVPASDFDEKITAVRHCNGTDYWVVSHSGTTNQYRAWSLTASAGLNTTPVVSGTGIPSQAPNGTTNVIGQMKLSPDGRRIARALFQYPGVEVADFNPETGVVSNARLLQIPDASRFYGVEFAPNSQVLYATALTAPSKLLQFDLSTDSVVVLATFPLQYRYGQLQLAPNEKLYVTNSGSLQFADKLGVIHQPNVVGSACNYIENGLSLSPTLGANLGLPGFVSSYFWKPFVAFKPFNDADTVCGLPQTRTFYLQKLSCAVDSVVWQITGNATLVLQNRDSMVVSFTQPGAVEITVRAVAKCGEASDTLKLNIIDPPMLPLDLGPDVAVCENGVVTLNAGSGWARYRWNNLSEDSTVTTTGPGLWIVDVWDECNRKSSDTVLVSIVPPTALNIGPDAVLCDGQSASFTLPSPFTSWQWYPSVGVDCDNCPTVNITAQTDTISYIAIAQMPNGCLSADTVALLPSGNEVLLSIDTSLCDGESLVLFGTTITSDTTFQIALNNVAGCDSLVTISATSWPVYAESLAFVACPDETLVFNGQNLTKDTSYIFVFSTIHGCDSIWTVQTTGLDSSLNNLTIAVCEGDSALFDGQNLALGGPYPFTYTDQNGCDSTILVQVTTLPAPIVNLPADTLLQLGQTIELTPAVSGIAPFTYTWQPTGLLSCNTCPAPTALPLADTWFSVTVTDAAGCLASDSMLVSIDPDCGLYVPNVFKPDDDGINDNFHPFTGDCVREVLYLRVYDRWGELVFERKNFAPNQENMGWDGTFRGDPALPGVYVWVAEFLYLDGGKNIKKGDVTIVR